MYNGSSGDHMRWRILALLATVLIGMGSVCGESCIWEITGKQACYQITKDGSVENKFSEKFVDSGTIPVGETISKYYKSHPSGMPSGGTHVTLTCYAQGNDTIIINATVWTDNCSDAFHFGYISMGGIIVNGDSKRFFIDKPNGLVTLAWSFQKEQLKNHTLNNQMMQQNQNNSFWWRTPVIILILLLVAILIIFKKMNN